VDAYAQSAASLFNSDDLQLRKALDEVVAVATGDADYATLIASAGAIVALKLSAGSSTLRAIRPNLPKQDYVSSSSILNPS
jgi:hypothetical protein